VASSPSPRRAAVDEIERPPRPNRRVLPRSRRPARHRAVFAGSYGEDGTIFGLPGAGTQLEVVRVPATGHRPDRFHQLPFYLADPAAVMAATAPLCDHGLAPDSASHPYWEANGALVYLDPDGRAVYAP